MNSGPSLPGDQRWQRESAYFDAQVYSRERLPAAVVERYMKCSHPYLLSEYSIWRLGNLRGKRILDVGCGDGTNALLFALKGATVVGIDLSERAIEAARARAELHGLSDRVRFVCGPIEQSIESELKFDIIAGFAVLHHLLPELNGLLAAMKQHGQEQTVYLFQEPVNLSRNLRRVRLALPLTVSGTPDERPLEPADLHAIESCFRHVETRYFHGLSRFAVRFLLQNGAYETRSWWRKAAYRLSSRADRVLFDRMNAKKFSSVAVIYAQD